MAMVMEASWARRREKGVKSNISSHDNPQQQELVSHIQIKYNLGWRPLRTLNGIFCLGLVFLLYVFYDQSPNVEKTIDLYDLADNNILQNTM